MMGESMTARETLEAARRLIGSTDFRKAAGGRALIHLELAVEWLEQAGVTPGPQGLAIERVGRGHYDRGVRILRRIKR